jgi:outer membrane receptor protein involved in Fe transport
MKLNGIFSIIMVIYILINTSYAGTSGKIVGTIKDSDTGEPLIGVNIVLEGTSLGSSTDPEGYFSIINVPPGSYEMNAFYIGYIPVTVENLIVSIDRTTTQDILMKTGILEGQTVVVEAERPAIELDRTHSSSVVSAKVVEYMPVTDISEVIELQAGIVSEDGQLHFRGGRAREVTYVVDGIPVSNSFSESGGSNVTVETNAIAELEVISGTFNAEYGSAQSGIVNIVTKKPGREFTGNVKTYIGEWLSNKDDVYIGVSNFNPVAEKDIQFNISGPIFDENLGFFLSSRRNEYESLDWYDRRYNLIDGWRIPAYTRWFEQHNGDDPNAAGVIYIPDSLRTGDGSKGPLRIGSKTSLNLKLVYNPFAELTLTYQAIGSFEEYDGPPDPLNNGSDQYRRYQPDGSGTVKLWETSQFFKIQHSPWKDFFYNLSFSYQHNYGDSYFRKDNRVAKYPGDEGIMPIAYFSNGFSLGSTNGFYFNKDGKNYLDQYLVMGNLNWQVDKYNFIKAGFEVKQHRASIYIRPYRATQEWDNYAWPLQDQLDGANMEFQEYWEGLIDYWKTWEDSLNAERFVAAQDTELALFKNFNVEPLEVSFYIQDKVELEDIIINAGLRLDLFQPNEVVPVNYRTESFNLGSERNLEDASIKYQISPRIGFSFPISANGAFHGSYGHFFQMPAFERMYNEPLVSLTRFQLDGRRLGNANLEAERTIAYEIGLQQGVTDDIAVDVTAYYKDFRNLLGVEQLTTVDLVKYQRYINRDYGYSKGITVGFTKSGTYINGGVNYTLSFANGSSSDPGALNLINTAVQIGGEDVVFVERKILSLDWDQRHSVNAYINFIQPNDWSIGLVSYYNSGVPYSPTFVERYDLAEREYRNSEFKPTRWSVDLKAQKNIDLFGVDAVLFLKIDNLFDHLNQERVYSSTGRADQTATEPKEKEFLLNTLEQAGLFTYDEVTFSPDNYSSPRKVQIGFEINF